MAGRRTAHTAREVAARLSWPSVLAWRMHRQHLAVRAPADRLLEVVSDLCGLHAQLMSSAELAAHARMDGLPPGAVAEALWERRTLVKTWAMRGTLHLLVAAELPLWAGAQATLKPRYEQSAWLRHHGLTREQAAAMVAAVPEALDAGPLTREELAEAVAARVGAGELAEKLRGGFGDLLKPAAFRGDLCFAPPDGRLVRFARPDRWLGPLEPVEPEEAAREAARRYLRTYGPATREWLARWFGMSSPALAGRWIASLGDAVVPVEVDGTAAWLLAGDVEAVEAAEPAGHVRLLPAFDQHVVTLPRGVDAVVPDEHRDSVYRPQGWLAPVVVLDGAVCGTWSHERDGGRLRIEADLFAGGAALRDGIVAEAERLAAVGGGELEAPVIRER